MSSQRILLVLLLLNTTVLNTIVLVSSSRADSADSGFSYNDTKSDSDSNKDQDYLPGEQVNTGGDRKMRVWSTRGPVEVNQQPPAAPQLNNGVQQQLPAGIIVDDRYGVRGGVIPPVEPVEVPRMPRR